MRPLSGSGRSNSRLPSTKNQIIFACFLATFIAYVERVGFSIAFTAISHKADINKAALGGVLSAFYWGYGVSQIPGGWAAQRWGGRLMLSLSFAVWGTSALLMPGSAKQLWAITFMRVVTGVAQGFLIPSIHTVLSLVIPPAERAKAVSLTTSGMYLGSAAAMLVLPRVAASAGPAAIFRLVGVLALLWLLLWRLLAPGPTARATTMPVTAADAKDPAGKLRGSSVPWRRMLLHPAVWAIVVNNYTFHYAFYVVMNWLPTYFEQVLGSNLADLGWGRTVPYLAMFLASNGGGWLGDYLIQSCRFSVASARKTVNSIGFVGAAGALMLMPAAHGPAQGIAATTCTLTMAGLARGGFSVNHMDIAPRHAGVVMGISNTAGTLAGVVGVAVTGLLLQHAGPGSPLAGWWQSFGAAAWLVILGSFVFVLFGRGHNLFGDNDS